MSSEQQKKSVLEAILTESCVHLFGAFGAPLQAAPSAPSDGAPDLVGTGPNASGAVIAFSGTSMRGALLLLASFELVAGCRPGGSQRQALSPASSGDWIYVRDWTKELANQLLGRIKNQLLCHGLTFNIGVPTALTGAALGSALNGQTVAPVRFVSRSAPVSVWFDAVLSGDAAAKLATKRQDAQMKEGDILLF